MSNIEVIVDNDTGENHQVSITEERFFRLVGQLGGHYEYGGVVELHFEKGYMKRDRITGKVLKAVYFCR